MWNAFDTKSVVSRGVRTRPSQHNLINVMRPVMYSLPLILLLCCVHQVSAQQYYKINISTGTYSELENPLVIMSDSSQMGNEFSGSGIKVPFVIEAFGQKLDFNQEPAPVIFAGGFIGIDITSRQRLYVFDGFASKLTWRDSTTSVSATVEGTPGEQVLKVQWKNMGMIGNSAADFVNLQMWLKEKDNSFEVHVGPNHVTGSAGYFGNNGPAIGGFITNYDFTATYAALHLTGDPKKPGFEESQAYYPLSATPSNGTIYRFAYTAGTSSVEGGNATASVVSIFPNPLRDRGRIQLPEAISGTSSTLVVHDLLGREVLRLDNVTNGDIFDRGALPAGVYYMTLHRGDRQYPSVSVVVGD